MQVDQEASATQAAALNLRAEEAESQFRLLESEASQVQVQAAEVSCWLTNSAPNLNPCIIFPAWVPAETAISGQGTAGVAAAGCHAQQLQPLHACSQLQQLCAGVVNTSQSDLMADFCIWLLQLLSCSRLVAHQHFLLWQ